MQGFFKPYAVRAGLIAGAVGVVILLLSLIPFIGCFIGLLVWLVYLGAGVLAVYWGKQQEAALTVQQGGIDGAVAGGIAGVIASAVKFIADVILGLIVGVAVSSNAGEVATSTAFTLVGNCFGLIFGIVFAIILGAVGGLVYAAIQQSQKKPA